MAINLRTELKEAFVYQKKYLKKEYFHINVHAK